MNQRTTWYCGAAATRKTAFRARVVEFVVANIAGMTAFSISEDMGDPSSAVLTALSMVVRLPTCVAGFVSEASCAKFERSTETLLFA